MRAFLLHYMRQFTYGGVLVLLAVAGLGVPAPQDLTLLLAGYLIEHGLMNPSITVPVCIVGAVTGDAIGFWLVRKSTERLRTVPLVGRILTPERMARAQGALARHEAVTIVLARNVAGLRTVVFASAGATGTPFARFLLWDSLAAIVNVALLLTLGYVFSHRLKMITREVSRVEHWIAFGRARRRMVGRFLAAPACRPADGRGLIGRYPHRHRPAHGGRFSSPGRVVRPRSRRQPAGSSWRAAGAPRSDARPAGSVRSAASSAG